MNTIPTNAAQLRAEVRARYARTALQVLGSEQEMAENCCGPTCCTPDGVVETLAQSKVTQPALDSSCCGTGCCATDVASGDPITSDLYNAAELGTIPLAA